MFERGSSFSDVIDKDAVKLLSDRIKQHYPDFKNREFTKSIDLKSVKFSGRIRLITTALAAYLTDDFAKNCQILLKALPPEIPEEEAGKTFAKHFIVIPMTEYIAQYGQNRQYIRLALDTLREMTKSFSSESAVRTLILSYPEKTLSYLLDMTKHPNAHVRRWASEGSRPRLPQAIPLKPLMLDPTPILPILEALRDDPHLYVRRSVANSFNDIAKDHPDLVVKIFKKWQKNSTQQRKWVIKHGLRTLLKKGHSGALALQGLTSKKLSVHRLRVQRSLTIGDTLEFSFDLDNDGDDADVMVDYVIEFKKKRGTSEKVFKLKTVSLPADATIKLEGKRHLNHFSTRTMYPGEHRLSIQVNGIRLASKSFLVT